ncbi:hypothetical protein [Thiomicrospira sp.]|uniref:hypothetical protein n=1 Tax=Thiomicrospira sp. TaxID=935 RepID=UPI002F91DB52
MLDKNYKLEQGFLAEIPLRFRKGSMTMLGIEPMLNILNWSEPGLVERYFKDKVPEGEDLELVRSRIVLSKITYFNPQTLDAENMQIVFRLAAQMLDFPQADPEKLADLTRQTYPVFSNWMLTASKFMRQSKTVSTNGSVKDSNDVSIDWCR